MHPVRFLLSFVLSSSFVFISVAGAQITNVTNDQATPVPGVGHDYIKMLNETVNPANGSVSVRIDVPTPQGRGLSLPFAFAYDSNGVNHLQGTIGRATWTSNSSLLSQGGWSYSMPTLTKITDSKSRTVNGVTYTCSFYTDYMFQDPTGGRHALGIAVGQNARINPDCNYTGSAPTVLSGQDNFFVAHVTVPAGQLAGSVAVASLDGTVYTLQTAGGFPSMIEDRNGNTISVTNNGGGAFSVTDTLGRQMLLSTGFGASGNTLSVSGLSAYTLTWANKPSQFTVDVTPITSTNCGGIDGEQATRPEIQAITLPNGKTYQFSYDGTYGLLNEIWYPSGGTVTYSWALNTQSELAVFTDQLGNAAQCKYRYGVPALQHRYVSFKGSGTPDLQQDFSYTTNWNPNQPQVWNTKQTTVTTHDNVRGLIYTTVYTYGAVTVPTPPGEISYFANEVPVETTSTYNDFSGSTLRTISETWLGQHLLSCRQELLNGVLNSLNLFSYLTYQPDPLLPGTKVALVTEKDEYGSGDCSTPANLLRKTVTNYASFPATPIYPSAASILDRPCQTMTYDSSGTNPVAETDYFYDGTTPGTPCAASTTQTLSGSGNYSKHDETNYGTSTSPPRGNLTTLTHKCLQSCTDAKTTNAFDETGQVLSMKDACGNTTCSDMPSGSNHTTTYSYADVYSSCGGAAPPLGATNAYLTKITDALGHSQSFCYGYDDGQLRGSTDQNDINAGRTGTTYSYNDPLRRLKETDYPDTGKTTISYNDAPPNPTVTTNRYMTSSQAVTTTATMDGLGHVIHTLQNGSPTTDPDCGSGDRTDTTYDGLGRVYTVSNPYCAAGEPTSGLATYTYDALGRTTQVTEQDGSVMTTSYSGNCTSVTDEAGKSRKSCSDGLGRLTGVWEDPVSSTHLNYETDYQYDALDNLLCVAQKGTNSGTFTNCASTPATWRPRAFTYDSLSRLTRSSNPESNTQPVSPFSTVPTNYAYDANGNLTQKAAPAPNQQTGSTYVYTNYGYDALNRVTSKTYSPNTTPGVYYFYDQTTWGALTLTNPIGRLTSEGTYDGTCYQTTSAFGYDPMGRVAFQEDYLDTAETSGCPGVWTSISASYDLAGNQTSLTYPSGRVVKSQFNGASRLMKLTVDDLNSYNYLSSANYTPFGSPKNFSLGNGLTQAFGYNKRLQSCRIGLASVSYSYSACNQSTLSSGNIEDFSYAHNEGTADNGNVASWVGNGQQGFSRSYNYDALNRLSTYADTAPAQSCKGLSWTYDAWGNRTDQTVTGGSCYTFHQQANTNNRLIGFSYDSAGNLLNDGTNNYTYDAENHLTSLNSGAATYTYDAQGSRMAKKIGSATTEYIHFNGDVLAEYNLGDQVWSDYIFAGGRRLAAAGTDDLFNPGFEQGLEGWIAGASDSSGSEQVITDATRAYAGSKYLQLSSTTAQVIAENQFVAVNPGDQLTFGGLAYLESGSSTGSLVSWNLAVGDANGNVLATPTTGYVTSAAWTHLSATYTVPAGGAAVRLYAQIYQPTGLTTARFDEGFLTGASGLGVRYYFADHLGSTRLVTGTTNPSAPLDSLDYGPFGEQMAGDTATHYKFTGKERDSESGLDYFGRRHYSSSLGRFASPDPQNEGAQATEPQSWNAYSYAANNPLKNTDPDGEDYHVCFMGGQCFDVASDQDFEKWRKYYSSGYIFRNGEIIDRLTEQVVGSYRWFDGDALRRTENAIATLNFLSLQTALEAAGAALEVSLARLVPPQVVRNAAKGKVAERTVEAMLRLKGYRIVGRHVTAKTSKGIRFVDYIVEKGGEYTAIEVKSGGAVRNLAQLEKDEAMESGGAFIGNNGGTLRGETLKLKTVEMRPF